MPRGIKKDDLQVLRDFVDKFKARQDRNRRSQESECVLYGMGNGTYFVVGNPTLEEVRELLLTEPEEA